MIEKENQRKYRFGQLFFLLLGLSLFIIIFFKQDFNAIKDNLQKVNYIWLLPVILVSFLGNVVRALRWQMLLKPFKKVYFSNILAALFFGYFVNLAFPRLGEISRSLVVSKRTQIPFQSIFGTVITERSIDILTLFLLSGLNLWVFNQILFSFFLENIFEPFSNLASNLLIKLSSKIEVIIFLSFLLLLVIFAFYFTYKNFSKGLKNKIVNFFKGLKIGLFSIFYIQNIPLFLIYTFLIWLGYFLMTYLWFFSLKETTNLGFSIGIILMVIGSWGKSLPIQGGGTGAYHFLVIQGFAIFSVSQEIGLTMALLIHTTQIIFAFFAGLIATIWLSLSVKKLDFDAPLENKFSRTN